MNRNRVGSSRPNADPWFKVNFTFKSKNKKTFESYLKIFQYLCIKAALFALFVGDPPGYITKISQVS